MLVSCSHFLTIISSFIEVSLLIMEYALKAFELHHRLYASILPGARSHFTATLLVYIKTLSLLQRNGISSA